MVSPTLSSVKLKNEKEWNVHPHAWRPCCFRHCLPQIIGFSNRWKPSIVNSHSSLTVDPGNWMRSLLVERTVMLGVAPAIPAVIGTLLLVASTTYNKRNEQTLCELHHDSDLYRYAYRAGQAAARCATPQIARSSRRSATTQV